MDIRHFFSEEQKNLIVGAIQAAEKNTSAEIRVFIDGKCSGSPVEQAAKRFSRLGMHRTKLRNGVLIYIALESRKCAIVGDSGIHEKVDNDFWNQCYAVLGEYFSKEEYCQGICRVIEMCGVEFKRFFEYMQDDVNELPDDICFGENNEK